MPTSFFNFTLPIILFTVFSSLPCLVYAQPANDNYASAVDLTSIINGCTSDAAYTTIGGTSDNNGGSCWNTTGGVALYNVWFRFTAPAGGAINVTIDITGTKGTQRRTQLALWQSDGTTQVACNRYVNDADDVSLGSVSLTPGATYYISVDAQSAGYRGTFTLCLNDAVDYDYYQGAIDLTSIINSCSSDAVYTTIGGTSDKNGGSCWNTAGGAALYNRWFRFTAPASGVINVTIDITGTKGTQRRTQLALWQSDGTTQVACNRYVNDADDVSLGSVSLTPGATYYISVDAQSAGYRGSFTLCLNDAVDYDYYQGAIDLTSIINGCSSDAVYTTIGGTSDKNGGSCWNTAGGAALYNRWFRFTAPASGVINVTIDITGTKGTQRRTQLALWQSDGITQVACNRYVNDADDVSLGSVSLTPGATYYISVDAQSAGYRGSFTLCLNDAVDYDYYQGAIELADINLWCSSSAAYTTIGGTSDKNGGSCWNTAGGAALYNRWFKFQATTPTIKVTADIAGSQGTQRRTQLALWQSDGITQVACNRYVNDSDDVSLNAVGLTVGNWYYISVDAQSAGYRGSFTLCVDDTPDYDFYEGANIITDLDGWCSSDAVYSTIGGTSDRNGGSCWNTAGGAALYNRWFKFQAIHTDATITVDITGTKGTQRRTQLALWQADGTTQVACSRYAADTDDVSIATTALVPGNWYYISVDAQSAGYRGTFTLCLNNVKDSYYSFANGNWNSAASWSKVSHTGPVASSTPGLSDRVYIQGHAITVNTAQSCSNVIITAATANTSLVVDGATLTINGSLSFTNPGNNFDGTITIQNAGAISVNDDASFTRSGGANLFGLTINDTGAMSVGNDMIWTSSAGSVNDNLLTLNNGSTLTISNDLTLSYTGGMKILCTANGTSALTVARDIAFTTTAANTEELRLNDDAILYLGRNFARGATPYGILTCTMNSTVAYNGSNYLQTFAMSTGAGGDIFTYNNVIANNTKITTPQLTLDGAADISGTLTLTSGIIQTTSANILTLNAGASTSIGSASSYVDGPMSYVLASSAANSIRNFPIGKSTYYRPAVLTLTHSDNTPVTYTAEVINSSAAALGYTLPGTVDRVSAIRYWQIDRQSVANLTDAVVQLYYDANDGVSDFANLTVVKTTGAGSPWIDIGGTATANTTGNITSGSFSSFSKFTLGNITGGSNPLPIQLLSFKGYCIDGRRAVIKWSTATEKNNHYFTLESSSNGLLWEPVFVEEGAGNSNSVLNYDYTDISPDKGTSYYRLKQTDFDGKSDYSNVIAVYNCGGVSSEVVLTPNPTKGEFSISFEQGEEENVRSVKILDYSGKEIYLFENYLPVINLSDQPYGMYYVYIRLESGVIAKRIMLIK